MTEIASNVQDFIDAHLGGDVEMALRGRTTSHKVLSDGRIKFTVSEILRDGSGAETGTGEVVGYWFGTPPPTAEQIEAQLAAQSAEEQRLLIERTEREAEERRALAELLEDDAVAPLDK